MQSFNVYLTFDGTCREAMNFYKECLDAELDLVEFNKAPGGLPEDAKGASERIMHAQLHKGSATLMASDCMPGMPYSQGNSFWTSLHCDSVEEVEKIFPALSKNGKVVMALHDAFWGARFGMITDQFGVNWMLSAELKK